MSEPPAKKSPWSKYYAERGMTRPPIADNTRPLFQRDKPDAPPPDPGAKKEPAAVSSELAAAIAAVTAAAPGSTAAPFITAMQKEAIARELKRRARQRLLRLGGIILAVVIAVPVVGTFVFNRTPSQPALAAHADKVAAAVLAAHSSVEQPLMTAAMLVKPLPRIGLGHLRYEVVVTLQLRAALYVPAHTNGTEAYRMLQRSLAEAKERAAKLRLFRPPAQAPELPEMPLLLQLSHRAGEPVVVKVPFDAHRFGWRWRLAPPDLAARVVSRTLTGAPLASFGDTRTLVFGSPESLIEVRRLVRLARDYVTAVSKAATVHAVADAPAVEAAAATEPAAAPAGPPDPGATAFDPNAPAKPAPNTPARPARGEPSRSEPAERAQPAPKPPAIDPNAPAVPRPKLLPPPR